MRIPFKLPVRIVTCSLFPAILQDDKVEVGIDPSKEKIKLTGWKAIEDMFVRDEYGDFKPEILHCTNATMVGMFGGAVVGGFMKSRFVYEDFIRNNHATAFQSHLEAKRALQSRISISFGIGAFRYGWRASVFCGLYALLVSATTLYKGEHGIWEYCAGGVVVGMLFRIHMGLRAMIVGGALAGFLGLVTGVLTAIILSLTGLTLDDLRTVDKEWDKLQREAHNEAEWDSQKPLLPAASVQRLKKEDMKEDNLDKIVKTEITSMKK